MATYPDTPRPVPIAMFGKDHWSTFAYAECRIVDNGGRPDIRHMRCDADRHPQFAHRPPNNPKYPTRLKDGELQDHDDWDCINDLAAAGLLEVRGTGMHPLWKLTEKGAVVAGRLRAWKTQGKNFADFEPGSI